MTDKEARRLKRQLETMRGALQVIHTWATFQGAVYLDPENVADLCEQTLEKCK